MTSNTVVALSKKSTNGQLWWMLLRAQFRVLDRFAPAVSDKRAAALFFTPQNRRKWSEPGAPGLVGEAFNVKSGHFHLAAWRWGHGPTVLLVHGWNGNAAQLSSFVRPLVDSGFRVVAFDLPAHGRSSGKRTTVLGMANAIRAVADAVGPLHAVVAHSLGATATSLAVFDNLPIGRAVLIAPPAAAPHFARRVAGALGLSAERTEGMLAEVQRTIGVHLESIDVRRIAGWIRQPALIFHDVADREVPFAQGRAIAEAWPASRLVPLQGLGHTRPLGDSSVLRTTVAFLREGASADMATSA
jgi:pimeloyl-ACP methyl ester carboxylesterase